MVYDAIINLKNRIKNSFESTASSICANVFRGHKRTLSTDIEDSIAIFLSEILPSGFKLILDASIYINNKNNRPDLIVVNEKNIIVAVIEIKSNMGWCRNATAVVDNIIDNHRKFVTSKNIHCKLSSSNGFDFVYNEDVKLYLISLTSSNCSANKHLDNLKYANSKNVKYLNLFDGWYNNLQNKDIEKFADELLVNKI